MSSRPATKRCVYPDPQSPSSYGLFLFAGSGPELKECRRPLGYEYRGQCLPSSRQDSLGKQKSSFPPQPTADVAPGPKQELPGIRRIPSSSSSFRLKMGPYGPASEEMRLPGRCPALNPAGVLRKSSCISELVANVYDGEWSSGTQSLSALTEPLPNWGRSSSISSVVR